MLEAEYNTFACTRACSYMGLYFTRGSLTYTAPVMVAEPKLPNIGMSEIGAMTSAFPMAYGLSK